MNTADIVIAGGGIIGLASALELAAAGLHVVVLERHRAMCEASWAAAGMLAAGDPENPSPLRPLSDLSIALYPAFLNTIESLSGLRVPIRTSGTLYGSAANSSFADPLRADESAARLPGLVAGNRSFFWLQEQSLDPRDLCAALPKAALACGVTIIEQSPVTEVRSQETNEQTGVEIVTPQASYSAAHFINCCGAWAGTLGHGPACIEPRKGQMVVVKLSESQRLDCVLHTPDIYLVPRGDGRVVIGASVEQAGFDKSVESATIQSLIDQAASLLPAIHEAQVVEAWAGLRPGSIDGLPIIDATDRHCWIAGGHFRNGILLAPATARLMRQLILNETASIDLTPFRCDRFADRSF